MKKFTHTKSGSAGFVPPRRRKGAPAAAGGTTKSGRTAPGEKPRVGRISDEAMRDCLAASGVTVNAVAAGIIVTDMTADIPETRRVKQLDAIPMSRFGMPDEVAGVVRFLASENAAYITGQTLCVDGGMCMRS